MAEAPSDARIHVDASRARLGHDVDELRQRLAPKALLRELAGPGPSSNGSSAGTEQKATGAVGILVAGSTMALARTGFRPLWAGAMHARRSKKSGVPVRAGHVALYIAVAALTTAAEVAAYRAVDRWVASRHRRR